MAKFFGNSAPGTNSADFDGGGAELPSCAILVSDRAPQLARWDLEIGAYTAAKGWTRVGRVLTVPPALAAVYGVPRVASAARVVALASCPAALRWRVTGHAVALDTNGTDAAIAFDPVAVIRDAQADVLISPYDVATGALGVQPVEAELKGSPVVTVTTFQIAVAAVATQVLPEDEQRLRAWLRVVAGGPVFLGPNTVTGGNGLALTVTDPPWEYDPRRPLFAADPAAAATLSVMVQRS